MVGLVWARGNTGAGENAGRDAGAVVGARGGVGAVTGPQWTFCEDLLRARTRPRIPLTETLASTVEWSVARGA